MLNPSLALTVFLTGSSPMAVDVRNVQVSNDAIPVSRKFMENSFGRVLSAHLTQPQPRERDMCILGEGILGRLGHVHRQARHDDRRFEFEMKATLVTFPSATAGSLRVIRPSQVGS